MSIKKQEFYEGAALHRLARTGGMRSVQYQAPFFLLNDKLLIYLKYCTKARSPWGFTFTAAEQSVLKERDSQLQIMIGFVCGDDGVAAVAYEEYLRVAGPEKSTVHVSCYRRHGEHYEVNGPDGTLDRKVAPSNWSKILES